MNDEEYKARNFGGNDDLWLMAYQTSTDRQIKTTISPESLKDEEVRQEVADTIVKMIENIILEDDSE